jgi:CelD/BcsL family acetyltransferase involved in cellulose biosynthesis
MNNEPVELHADAETIRAEWEELAERVGADPFVRPGWIDALAASFPGGSRLHAFTVRRRGRLAAIVPLWWGRGALRSPTNYHTPRFGVVAEDVEAAAELARVVLRARPRSIAMQFVEPSDAALARWCDEARASGFVVASRVLERCPYLELDGDWDAYERAMDSKLRADLRRRRRRLEELGPVRVELLDGTQDLDRALEEGMRVEAAGWKGRAGTAIASHANTRRLYRRAAQGASERGWLQLAFLRAGDEAIAFEFNVEALGVHYRLKAGYDERFQRFSPGKLLHLAVLERAYRSGLDRFEFGGTDEPYKLEWAVARRELALVQAFAPSVAGRLERFAYLRARPVVKELVQRAVALRRRGGR